MRLLVTTFLLLFSIQLMHANFDAANEAYKNGEYKQAIELYNAVLAENEYANAYYNLGNAEYKLGNYTAAIINYERALKIEPNNKNFQYNLKRANVHITDKIEAKPAFFLLTWWKQLAAFRSANGWTNFFLISLFTGTAFFIGFLFLQSSTRRLLFLAAFLAFALSLLLLLLSITQNRFENKRNQAIITASSVTIKSEPLTSGTDLFILHEGLKVKILKTDNDWLNIQLADGKEGWIKQEMLEVI